MCGHPNNKQQTSKCKFIRIDPIVTHERTPVLQKIGLLWPSYMQETVYVAQFTVGAIRTKVRLVL